MDLVIYGVAFLVLTVAAVVLVMQNSRAGSKDDSKVQSLLSTAAVAKSRGDLAQAAMLYEIAIAVLDASEKTDESLLCTTLVGQAECLEKSGKWNEAKALRNRLIAIWQSALDARRIEFFTDIDYLCSNGDFGASTQEIAQFYEKLLAYREKNVSQYSPEFINTIVIYAKLMRTLGEKRTADSLEQHAQKLRKGEPAKVELVEEAVVDERLAHLPQESLDDLKELSQFDGGDGTRDDASKKTT